MDSLFYYYHGEKIGLKICPNYFVVQFDKETISIPEILENNNIVSPIAMSADSTEYICEIFAPNNDFNNTLSEIRGRKGVSGIEYVVGDDNHRVKVSFYFYVQLKDGIGEEILIRNAEHVKASVVGKIDEQWYVLKNADKEKTSIETANMLWETGCCQEIDYGFLLNYGPNTSNCVTDTSFYLQWNMDAINVCDAWTITTGDTSTRVAVIDNGIDETHPEFNGCYFADSYNAMTGGSVVVTEAYSHGTHVGGILFANHNSGAVAGVSPNVGIINIQRYYNEQNADANTKLKNAINRAVSSKAKIINNSWGDNNGNIFILHAPMIQQALDNAIDSGILLVCSAGNCGNSGQGIDFPASYRDEILAVGATDITNHRASFSSYGAELDIVAPGEDIISTGSYPRYYYNSGTSMSAPHVTGVAALMHSVNPDLSAGQISRIIKGTAKKVGGYNYQYSINHLNGSWNVEMGHGLLDAAAAVSTAQSETSNFFIMDDNDDGGIEPNVVVSTVSNSPDIWLTDMSGNVVSVPQYGRVYNINVRVRNGGQNIAVFRENMLDIKWTVVGTDIRWTDTWTNAGTICGVPKSGSVSASGGFFINHYINPGNCFVVTRQWTAPIFGTSTCAMPQIELPLAIVAVVNDGGLTIGLTETDYPLEHFVRTNNNVAWKNYTLHNPSIGPWYPLFLTNTSSHGEVFKLEYNTKVLSSVSDVYLTVTDQMYNQWISGGRQSYGIEECGSSGRFKILGDTAFLDGIGMEAGEDNPLLIEVHFFANATERLDTFDFTIRHRCLTCDDERGGQVQLTSVYDPALRFNAIAHDSRNAMPGEEVTFVAESIGREADYIWTDMSGDTLSEGMSLTTSASTTQRYSLRVQAIGDMYIDADAVMLTIKQGIITSIDPNPAYHQVKITYKIGAGIQNPVISLATPAGITVYSSSVTDSQHVIDLQSIPAGHYYVRLHTASEETLDVKSLFVR